RTRIGPVSAGAVGAEVMQAGVDHLRIAAQVVCWRRRARAPGAEQDREISGVNDVIAVEIAGSRDAPLSEQQAEVSGIDAAAAVNVTVACAGDASDAAFGASRLGVCSRRRRGDDESCYECSQKHGRSPITC